VTPSVPPKYTFPVFDCVPFTYKAFEVFEAALIPIFPAVLIPGRVDKYVCPRPATVDWSCVLEIYSAVPRPATVDWKLGEIEFERIFTDEDNVLKAYVVDDREFAYKVDIELCVNPTSVEKVENPSLITAVEISVV
jgi:hypothetical protein